MGKQRLTIQNVQSMTYGINRMEGCMFWIVIVNTYATHCTTINETLRVYYRVTSLRKSAQRYTILLRDDCAQKRGLYSLSFIVAHDKEGLHRKMCRPLADKFSVCKKNVLWYNSTETESEEI